MTLRPAHAARPASAGAGRYAVLGAAVFVAIALGIAALKSGGEPVRSTPPSAQHMTDDATAP